MPFALRGFSAGAAFLKELSTQGATSQPVDSLDLLKNLLAALFELGKRTVHGYIVSMQIQYGNKKTIAPRALFNFGYFFVSHPMSTLINTTNRVWGFWVDAKNEFFFSGGALQFTTFLRDYSRLAGIEGHRLVLHGGVGEARSPWAKAGRSCDWKLYLCPTSRHKIFELLRQGTNSLEALQKAGKEQGYVAEVHFWTAGSIALEQLQIPTNVVIQKER